MRNIYENIGEYISNKKRNILIVFDEMIVGMLSKKELHPTVTDSFVRIRKLNMSLNFITQS